MEATSTTARRRMRRLLLLLSPVPLLLLLPLAWDDGPVPLLMLPLLLHLTATAVSWRLLSPLLQQLLLLCPLLLLPIVWDVAGVVVSAVAAVSCSTCLMMVMAWQMSRRLQKCKQTCKHAGRHQLEC